MALLDRCAQEVPRFTSTAEFGQAASFVPEGEATGFAITATFGDPTQAFLAQGEHVDDRRTCSAFASRALLRAGLLAALGTVRDPRRNDAVVVASGAYAGTWVVRSAQMGNGGGVTLDLVEETLQDAAGDGVQRVEG